MSNIPDAYLVVCDYGRKGRETIIDWEHCSKRDILDGLLSGQYERPIEVHCIDRNAGTWQDVSDLIAQDVIAALDHEPCGGLFDFCELHLGCQVMAELGREAWGAHEQFGVGA